MFIIPSSIIKNTDIMDTNQFLQDLASRLEDLQYLVKETNKMPVLILSQHPLESMTGALLPNIRESISNIICFVEIGDETYLSIILEKILGHVDRIILDIDNKLNNSRDIIETVLNIQQSIPVLFYSDLDVWGNTSVDFIAYNEGGLKNKKVLVCGNSLLSSRIIAKLLRYGAHVYLHAEEYVDSTLKCDMNTSFSIQSENLHYTQCGDKFYDIIIGSAIFNKAMIYDTDGAKSIYDVGLNNFEQDFIVSMRTNNASIYRYDNRAGISSVLLNLLETEYLIKYNMGEVRIGDIDVISGGVMGIDGAIVVDNAYNPQFVVGVANGTGIIKSATELTQKNIEDIDTINQLIAYGK